ncbi:hypothetical protein ACP70R_015215 [Stipagrostis hirtigluma subsp. patula]
MAPPRAPPELIEDVTTEILLRIPPDEPAHLFRAALVCKPWHRILTDAAFLRRYREFHRTPPLLGFLYSYCQLGEDHHRVITTAASFPCFRPAPNHIRWWPLDCRHGRVLLHTSDPEGLVVWDPITNDQQYLSLPDYSYLLHAAAVLCAVEGCDHLDCHGLPFIVVFVLNDDKEEEYVARLSVYSSETGTWSTPTSIQIDYYVDRRSNLLTRDTLYFTLRCARGFLKYDLIRGGLSVIYSSLDMLYQDDEGVVMAAQDGGLGFAAADANRVLLWSWQAGTDGTMRWVQCSVIELCTLISVPFPCDLYDVIGFAEGTSTIFVSTDAGVFTLDLKSKQARKVDEIVYYNAIIPYMSFYTPGSSLCACL